MIKWIISALLFMLIAWFLPGAEVETFWVALIASLVLGLIQIGTGLILTLILPLTAMLFYITFGLITIIINAFCIQLTSNIVDGFSVINFGTAITFAIIYSVLNLIFVKIVYYTDR